MPKVNLTHFEAAFLFALFASVVMGIVSKKTDSERVQYGLYLFACFIGTLIGLGWLMHFGHG
jgi:hypothetical protein